MSILREVHGVECTLYYANAELGHKRSAMTMLRSVGVEPLMGADVI
jgi:hypothetical protein